MGDGGYAATPAPLIPSASSDPLFHAALTVDADLRTLSQRKIDYLVAIIEAGQAQARAATEQKAYERVRAADRRAVDHLGDARSILRAAALHAYAGYGANQKSVATPEVQGGESVLPYRTYVRVTISDASNQVERARSARAEARSDADAAAERNRRFQSTADRATSAERAAKKAVKDAEDKLERDRTILAERIADMPDLAPGTFDELPDTAELPPGAMPVETPAGTIVVPAKADPRTAVALQFIVAQMGKPYVWGGTGPSSYDCSGLMLRAFQAAGVTSMPRVSQAQQVWATPVDRKDVQPGDLVFFGRPAYHVGVYIGGGLMINAPYSGSHVRVDRVWPSVTSYGRAVWSTPPPATLPVPEP